MAISIFNREKTATAGVIQGKLDETRREAAARASEVAALHAEAGRRDQDVERLQVEAELDGADNVAAIADLRKAMRAGATAIEAKQAAVRALGSRAQELERRLVEAKKDELRVERERLRDVFTAKADELEKVLVQASTLMAEANAARSAEDDLRRDPVAMAGPGQLVPQGASIMAPSPSLIPDRWIGPATLDGIQEHFKTAHDPKALGLFLPD